MVKAVRNRRSIRLRSTSFRFAQDDKFVEVPFFREAEAPRFHRSRVLPAMPLRGVGDRDPFAFCRYGKNALLLFPFEVPEGNWVAAWLRRSRILEQSVD